MQKFLLPLIALTSSIFCAEKDVDPGFFSYFKTGSFFPTKNFQELNAHAVHFGIGIRTKGEHLIDFSSHHCWNQSFLQNGIDLNYLYAPKFFYGAYVGIGIRVATHLNKDFVIVNQSAKQDEPLLFRISTDPEVIYAIDNVAHPILTEKWDLSYYADVPLVVGFHQVIGNKTHFIQAHINKDLYMTLATGFGF